MRTRWYLFRSGARRAAENMALDEALLESAGRLRVPLLRFYEWNEPAGSFGYSQKYTEVVRWTALRPLIRRPTGGGFVPHDADWTYSVVFSSEQPWYRLKAADSYVRIHEWIRAAFADLKVSTDLAREIDLGGSGRCFAVAERDDLMYAGKKIAGAAQRRNRFGLLIQGSVHPPTPDIARADWEKAMISTYPFDPEVVWVEFRPDEELENRTLQLLGGKYLDKAYIERR